MSVDSRVFLGAVFRHLLTFVGGWLVGRGLITEAQSAQASTVLADILPGLTMAAGAQVWSWVQKVKAARMAAAEKEMLFNTIESKDAQIDELKAQVDDKP